MTNIVRNDLGTKWPSYEMTGNVAGMPLVSRAAMCVPLGNHMYHTYAYCYHDCGGYMRRQGTHRALVVATNICEGNSMRLHIAASWYLFLPRKQKIMTIGRWRAPPYIPNMLQNSCRNRIVSYTVAPWSYYHPAGDVTRVSVMPRKVTVKIGDAENRCRGCRDKNRWKRATIPVRLVLSRVPFKSGVWN